MNFLSQFGPPTIEISEEAVYSVMEDAAAEGRQAVDWEFSPITGPTIMGVASKKRAAAFYWKREMGERLLSYKQPIVAYAGIGADKPVIEKALGIITPVEIWEDPMIKHWICRPDLASVPKSTLSDHKDSHVMGMMNIWIATMLRHDVQNHKNCYSEVDWDRSIARQPHLAEMCVKSGRPCPIHAEPAYCLRGESSVYLEDGTTMRIADIVKNRVRVKVQCVDHEGRATSSWVTAWHTNRRNGRRFYKLGYKGMLGTAKGTILTEDHPVLTSIGYVAAGKLTKKHRVNTGTPDFTSKQKSLLCGILLGDSGRRYGRIDFCHGSAQSEYLQLKDRLFEEFVQPGSRWDHPDGKYGRFSLQSLPVVKALPEDGTPEFFSWVKENLTLESLAVWFMDDGHYQSYQMMITCRRYTREQRAFLAECVETVCGVRPKVGPYGLIFGSAQAKVLSRLISTWVPNCLRYKLHPHAENREFNPLLWKDKSPTRNCYWAEPILENAKGRINWNNGRECDNTVFCLTVAKYNNFRVVGGIVHNCALDAHFGLIDDYFLDEEMKRLRIPRAYYEWRRRVAYIAHRMQHDPERGLEVDMDAATALDEAIKSKKAALFPATLDWTGKERSKKTKVWVAAYDDGTVLEGPKKNSCPKLRANGAERQQVVARIDVTTIPGPRLTKPRIIWEGPFNPNSPKAALQWFYERGIALRDRMGKPSMAKGILLDAIEKHLKPFGYKLQTDDKTEGLTLGLVYNMLTGEPMPEDVELPEVVDMLLRLTQKTLCSKGISSWVNTNVMVNGRLRPRVNSVGTSTMRFSYSYPNAQNFGNSGFAGELRRVIVARGSVEARRRNVRPKFKFVKGDAAQLEYRVCLWHAGQDPSIIDRGHTVPAKDDFEQLVLESNGLFDRAASLVATKPRQIAKSVVHAGNYAESIKLYSEVELSSSRNLADRGAGALTVFDGRDEEFPLWSFRGRVVCFTGINIADRLLGAKTRENRALCLNLMRMFFKRRPEIRRWQKAVGEEIEESREVRLPFGLGQTGHRVDLYGQPPGVDDLKYAFAVKGQGGGALYITECLEHFANRGDIPDLQVHDELDFTSHVPEDWSDDKVLEFMYPMCTPSVYMPGFTCPAEVKVGEYRVTKDEIKGDRVTLPNWKDTRSIGRVVWNG